MELGACHECASRSNLAFHVDFVHKFIAYGFFAEDTPYPLHGTDTYRRDFYA
jgi:hypothetical protein